MSGALRRPVAARVAASLLALLAAGAALAGAPGAGAYGAGAACARVVALGDLHGGIEALETMLRRTELVDDAGAWRGEGGCLVQLGDMVDRGARSREVVARLRALQEAHPERVFVLLGNHEILNLIGDLRYVAADEFAAYAADESAEERRAAFETWAARPEQADAAPESLRRAFDELYPPGWFAHRRAFAPDGDPGAWLLGRPVAVELAGTLYVHGGLSAGDCALPLAEINRRARDELRDFLEARERLIADGVVDPLQTYVASFAELQASVAAAQAEAASGGAGWPPERLAAARRYEEFGFESSLARSDGPVWNREWARAPESDLRARMETLEARGIRRVVVGHTTARDARIRARLDERVFLIDTGAGPAYEGSPSALVVEEGSATAVYPDEVERFGLPERPDSEVEAFLREADIVSVEDLGRGITRPQKVVLERNGERRKAVFKSMHEISEGYKDFPNDRRVFRFADSYRFERAAYLLDRRLGLRMVPVAVERRIGGESGVLVEWVEDAVDAEAEARGEIRPIDPDDWDRQRSLQHLFDALVHNDDRNMGNLLIRTRDWKLFLIDHTRTFRLESDLLPAFTARPVRLTPELLERLKALDLETLSDELRGLVDKARLRALLRRRDAIVERIEAERADRGDAEVFR